MHRFYCPNADLSASQAVISNKEEIHHLLHVLRLKANSPLVIFDGKGNEADGFILSIDKSGVTIKISSLKIHEGSSTNIILACAIPKKGKFELIIEKATELGVHEIIPLKTHRTEINLNTERTEKKKARYETVAVNAAKQSGRTDVPLIHPITPFTEAVESLTRQAVVLIPSLQEKNKKLLDALQKNQKADRIAFFIGPEGDFSNEEYSLAQQKGCLPVTLGKTILKVETAAICVLSCASQYYQ